MSLSFIEDRVGDHIYTTFFDYDPKKLDDLDIISNLKELYGKTFRMIFEVKVDSLYIKADGGVSISLKLSRAILKNEIKARRKLRCGRAPEEEEEDVSEEVSENL